MASVITVSGIGPKGGLALLSGCSADELLFGEDREARSYPPGYRELTEENRATVDALTAFLLERQRRE